MNARPRYRTLIEATSMIVGPGLMSIGDLMHPAENLDAAAQIAIVAQSPSHWYSAHLLLFIGFLLLVPGTLALSEVAMDRKPRVGYATRLLILISLGAFSAVVAIEMLLGRFMSAGASQAAAVVLLEQFQQSPQMMLALAPGLLAFFVGIALMVVSLASTPGPFRWPTLGFALGAGLILGEIILAQVRLSQIGNIVIFISGIAFARLLLQRSPSSVRRQT
jgi:hypothetical protein